jgi:hypothetical protein
MVLAKREITTSPEKDHLYSGHAHTQPRTLVAGTYARGDILELDEATDKLAIVADPVKAFAVMVHDCTLAGDDELPVYISGDQFNKSQLNFNGQNEAATINALHKLGIYVRDFLAV